LYQAHGYPINLKITPDRKKRGRWLVTVAAEVAAFSSCAGGLINNTFLDESPTTVRFYVKRAARIRETSIPVSINAPNLDCSDVSSGFDYKCTLSYSFQGTITLKGAVVSEPYR